MPFAIMLMPADVEAPPPPYRGAVEAAVQANGGRTGEDGVVRLADGGAFIFETDDFWSRRLSAGVCRIVFDAALRTNSYVDTEGSDVAPLKVEGSTVAIPPEMGPAIVVSSPAALCAKLRLRLTRWRHQEGRLRRQGVIGADGEPLEPPSAPGTEPRLPNDPSGIAVHCESQAREMASQLGWKLVRSVTTRNAQWGVVWRADIAPEADPATWMRESCWRRAGKHPSRGFSSRPLRMFDKSKSIEPLPAE